jgi:hypothetical protein
MERCLACEAGKRPATVVEPGGRNGDAIEQWMGIDLVSSLDYQSCIPVYRTYAFVKSVYLQCC